MCYYEGAYIPAMQWAVEHDDNEWNRRYTFLIHWKDKLYCIDASCEDQYYGPPKHILHSVRDANLYSQVQWTNGRPHLAFYAKRPIQKGDELLIDFTANKNMSRLTDKIIQRP